MNHKLSLKSLQEEEDSIEGLGRARNYTRKLFLQKIKESQSRVWWNSKEYKEVSASVEAFIHLSEQEPDLKNVLPLIQAHEKLGKACKTYLEARKGAVKERGKRRLSWVSMISSLQEAETDGINSLRNRETAKKKVADYSGRKWIDLIGDFRVPEISVSQEEVKCCKDGLSERLRIPYNGRNVYYTKSKSHITEDQFFEQNIGSITEKGLQELFIREKEVFKEENGQAKNIMVHLAQASEEFKDKIRPGYDDIFREEALQVVMNYLPDPFSNDFRQALNKTEVLKVFSDLSNKYLDFARNKLVYHSLELEPEQDLILHNVASSRIASLVGKPELLAEAWRAAVVVGGERSSGVCMEAAKGIEYSLEGQMELAQIERIDTAAFQKSVSSLHVLDLLCGQLDRHEGNMFYCAAYRNGRKEATGVQGIDNDVAFGNTTNINAKDEQVLSYREGAMTMDFPVKFGRLDSVVAVDSTLAVNILSLDRAALDYALGDLISKKQIDSMEERLKLIKGHLWKLKGKNGWLEDRLWNHETAGKMEKEKEGNYYTRAKMAIDMPRKVMLQAGMREVGSKNYREEQRNPRKSL